MATKIYDIIPCDKVEQKSKDFCYKEKKPKNRKPIIIGFIVFVFSLVGLFFFLPGKAEVNIYPNVEGLSVKETIIIDTAESLINFEDLILPGIIFSENKEFSEEYFSTGTDSKTKKATGVIRVYNKISPARSLSLIKNTRFLSVPGELVYRADEAFVIPASSYVDIKVTADSAGTKYNIPSATFSVPGLSGTDIYSSIWAETISDGLSGGEDSQIKIVTEGDIQSSKENFESKYTEVIKKSLSESIPESFIYFLEDILLTFEDLYADAQAGSETEKFIISSKVNSKLTAFRKDDLVKIGENLFNKQISDIQKIVPDSILCNIEEQGIVNGKLEIKVTFTADIYSFPDDEIIKESLINKKKEDSISILENMSEIKKVEINNFPFWRSALPNKEDSIIYLVKFD
ncbi:MAG: hypothetical protein PHU17_01915 [Candidatus Pacebacteria bacterium]|nr:hypothetical protein [Candidatus Paceibacterota bacterium]MDD4074262.1 hypothetical protein [Candidatus Paceibacterota bacterium]